MRIDPIGFIGNILPTLVAIPAMLLLGQATVAAESIEKQYLQVFQSGNATAVKTLPGKGADVNAKNMEGLTALMLAQKKGGKAVQDLFKARDAN